MFILYLINTGIEQQNNNNTDYLFLVVLAWQRQSHRNHGI